MAKWESGQVYPEITNFIQISNLFNATIDYLVLELKDGFVLYHGSYCEVKEPDLNIYLQIFFVQRQEKHGMMKKHFG